jgi:mannose/fructose-specific phosphotransferase system component IIA
MVIIAAHGPLADAFVATITLIAGDQPLLRPLGLAADASAELYAPVLILCDLLHGTPHHSALRCAATHAHVRVLAGLNLAMALEAVLAEQPIHDGDAWQQAARAAGQGQFDAA